MPGTPASDTPVLSRFNKTAPTMAGVPAGANSVCPRSIGVVCRRRRQPGGRGRRQPKDVQGQMRHSRISNTPACASSRLTGAILLLNFSFEAVEIVAFVLCEHTSGSAQLSVLLGPVGRLIPPLSLHLPNCRSCSPNQSRSSKCKACRKGERSE
jgi:hypothetical protein